MDEQTNQLAETGPGDAQGETTKQAEPGAETETTSTTHEETANNAPAEDALPLIADGSRYIRLHDSGVRENPNTTFSDQVGRVIGAEDVTKATAPANRYAILEDEIDGLRKRLTLVEAQLGDAEVATKEEFEKYQQELHDAGIRLIDKPEQDAIEGESQAAGLAP